MGLDLLGSANIDALKSKEFRETVDRIGKWGVWIALILALSPILSIAVVGGLDVEYAVGVEVAVAAVATGVNVTLPKLQRKKDESTKETSSH